MELITTAAAATTTTNNTATIKTPEAETEAPTRIQPNKPLSFSNGVLKRHHPLRPHHHLNNPPVVVTFKECLKNHAASLGGHAVDGCGEFMSSPTANPTDPTSLKCAACGCHRNFHRREPEEPYPQPHTTTAQHVIEYQPHHRHHPPPPPPPPHHSSSPNSPSPPPISSSYYPSAPHMLLALSTAVSGPQSENNPPISTPPGFTAATIGHPNGRKRFRTKFTQNQKERMFEFAEKVGWKTLKRDEEQIKEFCSEIGVDRGVLKVWMHNNKGTLGKRDAKTNGIGNQNTLDTTTATTTHHDHDNNNDDDGDVDVVVANGSSSSS